MATQKSRSVILLSLLVALSFVVSTGLVLAASPGDGHLKRNGAPHGVSARGPAGS